ncbi:MAG: YhdP family protein, partial [Shewanella sp.]
MAKPHYLKTISRVSWQLLALLLVLFALGVSLIRGLLPKVDEVRQQLVQYVLSEYQIDVHVGKLSAQWQAFGPEVNIHNLVIPPQDKLPVTLIINRLQIKLDFWQSLLTQSPRIEDVIFDGVNVGLDIDKLALSSAQGASASSPAVASANTDWLYQLLLSQLESFTLTHAALQLLSKDHSYQPIHIRELHWRNVGLSHRGSGEIYLEQHSAIQESLQLQLDIQGDGNRPDSLTGQIYLAAHSLDLGEWALGEKAFGERVSHPSQPQPRLPFEGGVNLEAWFDIEKRSVTSALVQFAPSRLAWSLAGKEQTLAIQAGQIQWQPTPKGWTLQSAGLSLSTNDKPWPALQFAAKQEDNALSAYVNLLDLPSIFPLLPLVPGVDVKDLELWQMLALNGSVGPVYLQQGPQAPLQLSAKVKQLQWQQYQGIPQLSPFDAKLYWQAGALTFALPAQYYTLDFGDEFRAPLSFAGKAISGQFSSDAKQLRI